MICKLCNQFYLDEDSIIALFTFSDICNNCKNIFNPKNLYEVIPINKGLIEYHYLYENMNLNQKQKLYLNQYLNILYLEMTEKLEKYDLFIFLDDNIYFNTFGFNDFINDYNNVYLFSLMRKELIHKELF